MNKFIKRSISILAMGFVALQAMIPVQACTGVIVGSELSSTGAPIFGRTEDLQQNKNKVYKVNKAGKYKKGEIIKSDAGLEFILSHDSYRYSSISDITPEEGLFDEAGFNEKGVMADATVSATALQKICGKNGADPLVENGLTESIMATLILAEADTARKGVELIADIVATKGAAEGNLLVIADYKELWYIEIYSGHEFFAIKYPKDKYSVFPNTFWLNTYTLNPIENKDLNYLVDKSGSYIYSKNIMATPKKAGTFVGDESKKEINLVESYANKMSKYDGNTSRVYTGIKALNKDAKVKETDKRFNFLQDAKKGSISLTSVFAFTRNRAKANGYPKKDARGDTYPIGNMNTMESHIFALDANASKENPGIMWLALSSPLTSPYVPYFPLQTEAIPQVGNPAKTFTKDSYYWLAQKLLHDVQDNAERNLPIVQKYVNKFENFLWRWDGYVPRLNALSTKEANENNRILATSAYHELLEAYNEIHTNETGTWMKDAQGWWLKKPDGSWYSNCWVKYGSQWYYFNAAGYMLTGWQFYNGHWYYLNSLGAMVQKWQKIDNQWYYFDENSGAMLTGEIGFFGQADNYNWYYLADSGEMKTGWQLVHNRWHYYDPISGVDQNIEGCVWMQDANGWWLKQPNGDWYRNAWAEYNHKWYYFNDRGYMVTGWQFINGHWYYLSSLGDMQKGWQLINGQWYYLKTSGEMKTGWQKINNQWYYLAASGEMKTGWQRIDNQWYYFNNFGTMLANTIIDGYELGPTGAMK